MTATIPSWQGLDLAGGRYRVTAKVPGGGMAEVYRALDRNLQTEVIIKVPLAELLRNPTFAARFDREVRSLVQLAHPHVVKVLDVGQHAGVPFAVMQFLAGGSLRDRQVGPTGAVRPLPPASLASWLGGVAAALDFVHAKGFIHRDVKPGNILFDAHGHPYLGDFGVIKTLAAEGSAEQRSHLTQRGTVLGTLQYLAPEVLLAQRFDGRADQFALAVTVYEVLTGRYPFQGTTPADIMGQQMHARPPAPHQLAPGIPDELSRMVLRSLAREPAERFPDCASFARAVLEAANRPVGVAQAFGPAVPTPPVAVAVTPGNPHGQAVELACPLCQEMLTLTTAHRGQRIRCPFCASGLGVSVDLRRVTAITSTGEAAALGPPPPEDALPPATFGPPSQTAEVIGPVKYGVHVAPSEAHGFRAGFPAEDVVSPAPHSPRSGRASAPVFLPDGPPRGKGTRFLVMVSLCLILLGGVAVGTYFVLSHFLKKSSDGPTTDFIVSQKGDGRYTTIQEALADAPADALILIRPGLYRESLILDKPVQLVGDGPVEQIILESSGAPCVRLQADSALLRGLTLRGKPSGDKKEPALEIPRGQLVVESCNISSEAQAGVIIYGPQVKPVLRKCKVHDCQGPGLVVHSNAGATLEECEVYGNTGPGMEVRGGAAPELSKCTLRDGKAAGLLVHLDGRGTFDDCVFDGNATSGVIVSTKGAPLLRRCQVRRNQGDGLFFHSEGGGTVEDCTIQGNTETGVAIRTGANPALRACRIHGGQALGVSVDASGKGKLEDCDIHSNALSGVGISGGSTPLLRLCKLHGNKEAGLFVHEGGKGTITTCTIYENDFAGVSIRDGSDPTLQDCTIKGGKKMGVAVFRDGKGTLEDCVITGNAREGVYISEAGNPWLRRCKLRDNTGCGLLACEAGKGTAEDCEITGSAASGVEMRDSSAPVLRRCHVNRNRGYAVMAHKQAAGTVENCDLTGNTLGARSVESGSLVNGAGNTE